MPRKARPGLPSLHIEKLSTGEIYELRDEFTGELIAQPNAQPLKTAAELAQPALDQRTQARLSVLVDAGLGSLVGYARAPILPAPKHNQVFTESGLVITVKRSPNAFKRRL